MLGKYVYFCEPWAIVAVTDGVQGEPDWHAVYMDSAHAGRMAAEESFHSIDLLANVAVTLSQDDRDTSAGLGFTVVPRTPFVPLKEVDERLRQFGDSGGLLWRSGKPETLLFTARGLRWHVVFGWRRDLQNLLLSTNDSRWEYLNMTLGQYCWFDDGGDSLTTGFLMTGQCFSPYGQGLSRELGDLDVCVCGLKD